MRGMFLQDLQVWKVRLVCYYFDVKLDNLSDEIQKSDRRTLSLYKNSNKVNQRFLDYLLDFIEEKWRLLPRESPELQICFKPALVAFVQANKTRGGIRISLFGKNFISGKVVKGKFLNWRAFDLCHSDDQLIARSLIEEAYEHRMSAPKRAALIEEYNNL